MVALTACLAVAAGNAVAACNAAPQARSIRPSNAPDLAQAKPANIVLVLTDDLSWNLVERMPEVRQMQHTGVTFSDYFVSNSLCCPSRSTILTGRFPHNTRVYHNSPPNGGFAAFRDRGAEASTFATALSASGYRTALMGKYLNGYDPSVRGTDGRPYIPPGWTDWAATGEGYGGYNYTLNENGKLVHYGKRPRDYLTDVMSSKSVAFIDSAKAARRPFMLMLSTFAPHHPYTPAPRHKTAFPHLKAPRPPGFNEPDVSDKPSWIRRQPKLGAKQIAKLDRTFRDRVREVQAVDEMIGRIRRKLASTGLDRDTYLVFTSDNGYHLGEHRLESGKITAYETDIRVPLIATGPGVPAGRVVPEIAQNTDLYPTFLELGGLRVPPGAPKPDGRSLVALLRGGRPTAWRTGAFVSHYNPKDDPNDPDRQNWHQGTLTPYQAVRTATELYVEYADQEREYYDLRSDPYQLNNIVGRLDPARLRRLSDTLRAFSGCAAAACTTADRLP